LISKHWPFLLEFHWIKAMNHYPFWSPWKNCENCEVCAEKNTIYASTYYVLDCPTYWYKSQMRYLRGRNIWENIYFPNKYFNTEFWLWYSIVTAWIECNSLKMWRLSSNYFVPKKKDQHGNPIFGLSNIGFMSGLK